MTKSPAVFPNMPSMHVFYLGSNLVSAEPWFPDEINSGYVERYMFLMAVLLFVNFLAFLFVAKSYRASGHGLAAYMHADDIGSDVSKMTNYQSVGCSNMASAAP